MTIVTPAQEPGSPFTSFASLHSAADPLKAAVDAIIGDSETPTRWQASSPPPQTERMQRRVSRRTGASRSSSRHPGGMDRVKWHITTNPHANGGLRNAVNSVGNRLKEKLWIGVLGTPTDKFDKELRDDINQKMRREVSSVPVWIPDTEFSKCYDEFCHQVRISDPLSRPEIDCMRRSSGLVSTMPSQMHPRLSLSWKRPHGNNMSP